MDAMHVRLNDGTGIECTAFRAIDGGVLLFDQLPAESDEDEEIEAIGFVPHHQLQYVLDDERMDALETPAPPPQQHAPPQGRPPRQPGPGDRPPHPP